MAKEGQHVTVHYVGTLDDGTVFDSSIKRDEPIDFILGGGQMIPGFENAVLELEEGETKTVRIPAAEAYGEYQEDAIQPIPLEKIGHADQLPVGGRITFKDPEGHPFTAKIVKIEDGNAYFDFNHELAGQDLTFEITLVKAEDVPDEDDEDDGSSLLVGGDSPILLTSDDDGSLLH